MGNDFKKKKLFKEEIYLRCLGLNNSYDLERHTNLNIQLKNVKLGDDMQASLGKGLSKCRNLRNLSLDLSSTDEKRYLNQSCLISSGLSKCKNLMILTLKLSNIDQNSVCHLCSFVGHSKSLESLTIDFSGQIYSAYSYYKSKDQVYIIFSGEQLFKSVANCKSLKSLILQLRQYNVLTYDLIDCLNNQSNSLTSLTLIHSFLGIYNLCKFIGKYKNLSNFYLELTDPILAEKKNLFCIGSGLAKAVNLKTLTLKLQIVNSKGGINWGFDLGSGLSKMLNITNLTLEFVSNSDKIFDQTIGIQGVPNLITFGIQKCLNLTALNIKLSYLSEISPQHLLGLLSNLGNCTNLQILILDFSKNLMNWTDLTNPSLSQVQNKTLKFFSLKIQRYFNAFQFQNQ
ncbi:hypothetical protein ABPG72_014027, partial [Tetrahymena utriculariae]